MNCSICGRPFATDDEPVVLLDEEQDDEAQHFALSDSFNFKPGERIACGRCAVEALLALHALVQRARSVRGDHLDERDDVIANVMVSSDEESLDVLVNLCSSAAMLADD